MFTYVLVDVNGRVKFTNMNNDTYKEKFFKSDIILYKNGKYEKIKNYKKIKSSKIKTVLLYCKSNLNGYTYYPVTPSIYNKIRKIKNIKFSYKFLDGQLIELEDAKYLWVKNVFYYDDMREVISKLMEILLSEHCLNENIWLFNSFYSYIFSNYKVSFDFKGKNGIKKYKFNNLLKFYKFIFGSSTIYNKFFDEGVLSLSSKKYDFCKTDNISDKKLNKFINNKDNDYYISINNHQFTYINPKFLKKYKTIDVKSNLYITELDGNDSLEILDSYKYSSRKYEYNDRDIELLYIVTFSPFVLSQLESSNCDIISYHLKNKVKYINDKKVKGININDIVKKYFPGTKYGIL